MGFPDISSTLVQFCPQLHLKPPSPGLHLSPPTHRLHFGLSSLRFNRGLSSPWLSLVFCHSGSDLQISCCASTLHPSGLARLLLPSGSTIILWPSPCRHLSNAHLRLHLEPPGFQLYPGSTSPLLLLGLLSQLHLSRGSWLHLGSSLHQFCHGPSSWLCSGSSSVSSHLCPSSSL